jgi:hypothetical protein
MTSLQLLYCGPYTTSYGLRLIDSAKFLSWLYSSNTKVTFVGPSSKNFEVCPIFNELSSPVHSNLGYISDNLYDLLLDDMDAGLSLQSDKLLETHYPSKFFEFCLHKMICISTVDMNLDFAINKSYVCLSCYSTESLVKSLDEVINNFAFWRARSLELHHTLYSNVRSTRLSNEIANFLSR